MSLAEVSLSPYPPSPVLSLAGLGKPVRRDDLDGDNWPLTWADDGRVYAAYGDGWGCRPVDPATKRNTGMVALEGAPPLFSGQEVEIPYFGAGAQDPNLKGCGLLSAGGTLYHFLRYQVNPPADPAHPPVRGQEVARIQAAAALIWSADHGATWQGDTAYRDARDMHFFFDEPDHAFSAPTFLQAGRDYRQAQDGYVYLYAPREDRRRRNDHLHLARVRREHVTDRAAYEFFHGFSDAAGVHAPDRPRWTHDVTQHIPVFAFPEHVGAGDVLYLPRHRRYLLVTCRSYARHDVRPSALGLFDAPHPWGPWTTAGYVPEWGSGQDGDCRYDPRLPAAWLAEDDQSVTCTLVFSDRARSDVFNYQSLSLAVRR